MKKKKMEKKRVNGAYILPCVLDSLILRKKKEKDVVLVGKVRLDERIDLEHSLLMKRKI